MFPIAPVGSTASMIQPFRDGVRTTLTGYANFHLVTTPTALIVLTLVTWCDTQLFHHSQICPNLIVCEQANIQ